MDIVSKSTVTHDLPNSDLLLGKYLLVLLVLLREGGGWLRPRCVVAAAVEMRDFGVGFTRRTFGPAHAS